MDHSAAFYKTFFQHDTLFRVEEDEVQRTEVKESAAEAIDPISTAPDPVSTPVVAPSPSPVARVAAAPQTVSFPALRHRILVLVDEPDQADLKPANSQLLQNILKATGHSMDETDLLNFSYIPQADARTVLSQKSTNYFITFGVPLIRLQIDLLLPPYMPKQIEGIWFLLADPLHVIDADKLLKKRLWLALQKMFAMG